MRDTHVDEEQRYRPRSRSALYAALPTFGLAGIVGLLGYGDFAVGLAVVGGAMLTWAGIYLIMHRV